MKAMVYGHRRQPGGDIRGSRRGADLCNSEMCAESGYTAVTLMNTDPPAVMPVAKAIRDRIPAR